MMLGRTMGTAALLLVALALVACGGGGGAVFGGGISGTGKPGVKYGEVDTSQGVTVSGTTFDTTAAVVHIGGQPAVVADLRDGHVALVEGIIDGAVGTAGTITVEDALAGILQAKPTAHTLLVQGVVVEVGEGTVFGAGIVPAGADGLLLGDSLEIWGFVKSGGVIAAKRIEREAAVSETRLTGAAMDVDTPGKTFRIGSQAVDYASADVSELPAADPGEGAFVRVRGAIGPGDVLVATRVEPLDMHGAEDNEDTEVEGFVTEVVSTTMFRLGSLAVVTNAATRYEGGSALDVVLGAHLEVEGAFAAGVLTAREIEFGAAVRLESDVASVAGNLVSLVGLPGIVVKVTDLTAFDGDATGLGDLQPGDHVEIRANAAGGSNVVAVQVKETGPDTEIEIQGPVDAAPAPSNPVFTVLGVAIDTSGVGEGDFESPDGAALDRAAFFERLRAGDLVRISGVLAAGVPAWGAVEIEGSTLTKTEPAPGSGDGSEPEDD